MKTTLNRAITSLACLAFSLAFFLLPSARASAAETFWLPDFYYPIVEGNEWVYDTQGNGDGTSNMLMRVETALAPLTSYSGRSPVRTNTQTVARLYCTYGTDTGTGFTPTDWWYEYPVLRNGWGYAGFDDNPGISETRFDPCLFATNRVAVGTTVSTTGNMYTNSRYAGPVTFQIQVLGLASIAVPAGTYTNCLHVKTIFKQSQGSKTSEEWWARGVGVVKRTEASTRSTAREYRDYQLRRASVVTPPILTQQPVSATNAPGSTGWFSVIAMATGTPAYEWRKNGVALSDSGTVSGSSTTTLTLSNLSMADAGNYSVVVRNDYGSVTSAVAVLMIRPPESIKPTLTISNPAKGARLLTETATVKGTTKDNVAVAGVYVQLNGGDWVPAATTNGWANWTLSTTLRPGLNTLLAYAVDSSGNLSRTNSVQCTYVLSAPLTVTIEGKGAIAPNYNGSLLEIGKTYTMNARPGVGFKFSGWSGSQSAVTPSLRFQMATGLVFTANFVDVQRPVNTFLSPKLNQVVNSGTVDLAGKTSDNSEVAQVFYQVNGGAWQPATTSNHWTNWTAAFVPVQGGKNEIRTYAEDPAGNHSLTNTVTFSSTVVRPNLAGLWNAVSFQTPAYVTWDAMNGLQTGGGFETRTGTLLVDTNGTLAGNVGGPFTGTHTIGTNGQWLAQITDDSGTRPYTLHLDGSQDTLTFTSRDSVANNMQEVLIFQRAPGSAAPADLAGAWNIVQFDTPAYLGWDQGSGLIGGSGFGAAIGTLTMRANGTFSANVGGAVTGTYTLGSAGQVSVLLSGDTQSQTLALNAAKDIMVLAQGENSGSNNFQELMLFARAPLAVTKAELAGLWNVAWFATSARMTWPANPGSFVQDNFNANYGTLTVNANGTLSGDIQGAFSGTYTIGGNGKINVKTTGSHGTSSISVFLNASKDTMLYVSSSLDPSDNIQQLMIFQKAPVFTTP